MNVNKILNIYKKKYPELNKLHIKIVPLNNDSTCVGKCELTLIGEFINIGKMRYRHVIPDFIQLTENDKDITFTLLHEISHAITPYYERKVKDQWICMDHSDKFYKNYLDVVKIAFFNKIIDKEYDMKALKIRDKN